MKAIPHFEKSVSINPLQNNIWLRLGYAALQTENWQVAATAYRRCTTLEPDGFEAWNNLAQAYIKLGNKRSAHHALLNALRCDFENWKVWENFLLVSSDVSRFTDMINAYHKLLSLKEKYLNTEMLIILTYGVFHNAIDCKDESSEMLMQKTRELFGRLTSIYPGEAILWELYSNFALSATVKIQRLQRAYRGYTKGNWNKSAEKCKQVVTVCQKMAESALTDEIDCRDPLVNSIRLNLSSTIAVIKKQEFDELKDVMQEITHCLARLIEKNKKGNAKTEPENQ